MSVRMNDGHLVAPCGEVVRINVDHPVPSTRSARIATLRECDSHSDLSLRGSLSKTYKESVTG